MNDLDIKEIRKNLGVSQEKLAEMLGVVRQTVRNWENGAIIPQSKRLILTNLQNQTKEKEKIQDPQRDETLSPDNNNQIADLKKRIAELEATIQTLITSNNALITSNNALIATNKQLVNTIDRLTSDPGAPGNAILVKTTKTTNGSIQPVIHVAELDSTKYQARKKRMILKK
jgi:transcriptional regulator with XRE-family HTH domain